MAKTFSHSQSFCEGSDLSTVIEDKRSLVELSAQRIFDESFSPNPGIFSTANKVIPDGKRTMMFRYLLGLRKQFQELGMEKLVQEVDAVFRFDKVLCYTGNVSSNRPISVIDAASLGRQGGLKGGKARAAALTPEQRSESARFAARARWDRLNTKEIANGTV